MKPDNTKAFTLIELLVVIAIIAILAAILFPVFATAREKARQTACESNLKQFGLALQQYEQDYDEYVPSGNGYLAGWGGQLYPYVKSTAVYSCPSDPTSPSSTGNWSLISYAINQNMIAAPIAKFASPALSVYLTEVEGYYCTITNPIESSSPFTNGYMQWNSGHPVGYTLIPNLSSPTNNSLGYHAAGNIGSRTSWQIAVLPRNNGVRHGTGSNFLLSDGHVKFALPTLVSTGYTPTGAACAQDQSGCNPSPQNNSAASTDSLIIAGNAKAIMTFSIL
ncbi:MAG: DUF1559 domain-containing protein [Capsulimonadaceae bacterium]|nr:DUF1559 domain-containing protein [Capsulimonadaceae bacterium]